MTINDMDSIDDFIAKIRNLTSDPPIEGRQPGYNIYKTQKDHWLGWLGGTADTGAAYQRKTPPNHGARFVYNHIVEPKMLLWLIEAAGVKPGLVVSRASWAHRPHRTIQGLGYAQQRRAVGRCRGSRLRGAAHDGSTGPVPAESASVLFRFLRRALRLSARERPTRPRNDTAVPGASAPVPGQLPVR
jgi:hypothetical protein